MLDLNQFREVLLCDFEFSAPDGCRPRPVCVVAHELRSGKKHRVMLWGTDGIACPYPTGPDTLFTAYYASAELGCHLQLGWPMPTWVLDLKAEFSCLMAGRNSGGQKPGTSLLDAMAWFGLPHVSGQVKEEMRALAIRGGPYTSEQASELLAYCETDVVALALLLPAMLAHIPDQSILRGRYMKAAARMEDIGIPIDTHIFSLLEDYWPEIKQDMVDAVDPEFGVYDGIAFNYGRFKDYLVRNQMIWAEDPQTLELDLKGDAFRTMALVYPHIGRLHELKATLDQLDKFGITIGRDGRNRCLLGAFSSKTSRNQPSTSKFIIGRATCAT